MAEALFDLANMFANAEPALEDSPSAPTGPKSKRQRLKLQQQQERQAEQVRRPPLPGTVAICSQCRFRASTLKTYGQTCHVV